MFLPSLFVHVNITYKEAVQVEGLDMNRYELNDSDVFVFKKGLIDVSKVYSLPSYMSYPRFLKGDPKLWERLNIAKADKEKHGTFVSATPFF